MVLPALVALIVQAAAFPVKLHTEATVTEVCEGTYHNYYYEKLYFRMTSLPWRCSLNVGDHMNLCSLPLSVQKASFWFCLVY